MKVMAYITARLASWSALVTPKGDGFTSKVTKAGLKKTLATHPRKLEFNCVSSWDGRRGYFFADEVVGDTIELRYNSDRDVAMIEVTKKADGTVSYKVS